MNQLSNIIEVVNVGLPNSAVFVNGTLIFDLSGVR